MSRGIRSPKLSVSFFEKAPQAITILSKVYLSPSVTKTGFSVSNSISLIFLFSNFPPFFKNNSNNLSKIFLGFRACRAYG